MTIYVFIYKYITSVKNLFSWGCTDWCWLRVDCTPEFRLLERVLLYVSMTIIVTSSNTLGNQVQVASENALDGGFSYHLDVILENTWTSPFVVN